jgi:hypothetical protein
MVLHGDRLNTVTDRAASMAALVNGLVMAVSPLAAMLVAGLLPESTNNSTTVHAAGAPGAVVASLSAWIQMWRTLVPLSAIAGWRTFVYARRWLTRGDRAWLAVLEAGAWGFLCVLLVLAPGILRQPAQAPPYVIVYGGVQGPRS